MAEFSHIHSGGGARMVDTTPKAVTPRRATACGEVAMNAATLKRICEEKTVKGDVLGVARIAAIMAAKTAFQWIPLCHPLQLDHVRVDFAHDTERSVLEVRVECRARAATGVEMEALTAVAAACLTIYDMCKSADRAMTLGGIRLLHKSGGRSGIFNAREGEAAS